MKKLITGILVLLIIAASVYYFFPEDKLPPGIKIDRLVVRKRDRIMQVYSGDNVIKTYRISLGRNPTGDKEYEGDKKTPEGEYKINDRNPESGYHKNLGISYPNTEDIAVAKRKNLKPGGEIKIHGLRNGLGFIGKFHRMIDWTAGCIALTNEEIDELYDRVEIGTPIIIQP
jgi:murein L,D-transpeptidase YafK